MVCYAETRAFAYIVIRVGGRSQLDNNLNGWKQKEEEDDEFANSAATEPQIKTPNKTHNYQRHKGPTG